jgi:hypothetical protein
MKLFFGAALAIGVTSVAVAAGGAPDTEYDPRFYDYAHAALVAHSAPSFAQAGPLTDDLSERVFYQVAKAALDEHDAPRIFVTAAR